jgi:large subunit ribosomal protein L4
VSADEIKKTPEGEPAEPEKTKAAPVAKKPAAKKAPSKKPAAAKADEKAAKPAARKPAAKADKAEPAAKKPAAKKAAPAKAAKAAAETKAAGEKPAAKAVAKPARKRAAAKSAAAKPAAAEKPAAQRPPKPTTEKKAEPEARKGAAGVATVVDASGKEIEARKLTDARFAVAADVNTLHLVVRAEQASRRSGTASTKTRGEVSGSTAKLYRQKGTGRARSGSVKSPIRTGGGIVFGPRPRSFDIKVNKKVARKALAMALSERAAHGRVFVAAGLELEKPSTRTVEDFLVNLDCAAPVLVVTHDEPVVLKSVRNLPYAEASEVAALSTEQVLRARSLVLTEKAFAALNEA